jgi:perosamine synthetase
MEKIPVCEPLLDGNELKYVTKAVSEGWISSLGDYILEFENRFASFCGTKYALTTTSGTTALHLACAAIGLKPGDEVIVPDFTMIAPLFGVCYTGAKPVFVDAEPVTWCMDASKIEEKITPRTKAILPVHIYGHPCDMAAVMAVAARHGLKVIEDCAESHGATDNGTMTGTFGDIGCFSLYANKLITTGEGGLVVTDSKEWFDRCRYLRNISFPLEGERIYVHDEIGFNYRMPNTLAAIGLAQLENIERFIAARIRNARLYTEGLKGVPGITVQPTLSRARNVYWMFGILVGPEYGMTREELLFALRAEGIETRRFFRPMHTQLSLKNHGCDCTGAYPVSDLLGDRGLYLPSGSGLTESQVHRVCETVRRLGRSRT